MTAREKFEEIGYKYSYIDGAITNECPIIEYMMEEGKARERIVFSLNAQRVYISASDNQFYAPAPLSLEEIKAIKLQCIELGWKK